MPEWIAIRFVIRLKTPADFLKRHARATDSIPARFTTLPAIGGLLARLPERFASTYPPHRFSPVAAAEIVPRLTAFLTTSFERLAIR